MIREGPEQEREDITEAKDSAICIWQTDWWTYEQIPVSAPKKYWGSKKLYTSKQEEKQKIWVITDHIFLLYSQKKQGLLIFSLSSN